ncbi:MAG TPA: ABC transporter permease [Pseudonocardia sp.]|nr:ABC transporter permease [Pseudonocardia sp.]
MTPGLGRLAVTELRLFLRDPAAVLLGSLLPTAVLLALGAIPALRTPDPTFGGERFVDVFAPSLLALSVAMLGLQTLPVVLATYREQGVLRRFATTPTSPAAILGVQLAITVGTAVAATVLMMVVASTVLGVPAPRHPLGFLVAFLLGTSAVFAIGLVVAATAPRARTATGVGTVLFVATQFLGGVYLPTFLLPDLLVGIGAYVPPSTAALRDAWTGAGPRVPQLLTMLAVAVMCGVAAARLFRWE